jgi:L-asparaginase
VAYAVSLLEDDELYNAGIGSQIQSDGIIRMSAAIMNGETQKMSGVINIQDVKNPIFVAKELMKEDDRVLGGNGAKQYANQHGFENFSTEIPQRRKEYEEKLKTEEKELLVLLRLTNTGNLLSQLQPVEKVLKSREESLIRRLLQEILPISFVQ